MKKVISLIVLVLLIVTSFVGCSGNNKTEEELKAEIKAEMEAEAQQKEKQKEEVKAEPETEKKGSSMEGEEQKPSDNKQEETTPNNEQKETASNNEQEKPAVNNYEGDQTVDASNLKVGDMIYGHTINKLIYKKGDEFGIGLDGEFTVTGEISYDADYYGAIVLSTDEASALPTKIKFKFDDEYEVAPPSGTFIIDGDSLNVVKSAAPNSFLNDIKNGATYKIKAVIKDYAFAAKNHSEGGCSADIVKIIDFEANNDNETVTGTPSNFSSENINGKQVYFNSDETIIVPMYNGVNISALESDSKVIGNPAGSYTPMELNFAVFGKFRDVVVTYYEGMDSDGISTEIGTFSNTNVELLVYGSNNDMTYLKVTGKVNGEASLIDVEFTLDDMRDPSDYEVIVY